MRKSRLSEEQILRILGEVEAGSKVKDVCSVRTGAGHFLGGAR